MPSDEAMEAAIQIVQRNNPERGDKLISVSAAPTVIEVAKIIEDAMQPKWTRVEDELPDIDRQIVILWVINRRQFGTDRAHTGIFEHDGTWQTAAGKYLQSEVTHWMPLPPPPKEDR